jgi:hypothetical protein
MHDSQKRLRDLCKQAVREKDQEKLKGLTDRILEIWRSVRRSLRWCIRVCDKLYDPEESPLHPA